MSNTITYKSVNKIPGSGKNTICACACARACVRACVCARVCACVCVGGGGVVVVDVCCTHDKCIVGMRRHPSSCFHAKHQVEVFVSTQLPYHS